MKRDFDQGQIAAAVAANSDGCSILIAPLESKHSTAEVDRGHVALADGPKVDDEPQRSRPEPIYPEHERSQWSRSKPLDVIRPSNAQRAGDIFGIYVPNVVYSCGGIIHGNDLILPFRFSDVTSRIAKVPLDALLTRLTE